MKISFCDPVAWKNLGWRYMLRMAFDCLLERTAHYMAVTAYAVWIGFGLTLGVCLALSLGGALK